MEAELINHIGTTGLGGGGAWLLWRLRKVESESTEHEIEIRYLKKELAKGSDKFEKIEEKLDGIRDEIHSLALEMKRKNGG